MTDPDLSAVIRRACQFLSKGNLAAAEKEILAGYPFTPVERAKRNYSPFTMTRIFLRDGFIDRYRGTRLVFPPALRVLSIYMPKVFPYHKNGKMDEGHLSYWELFPTIDHIFPIARGGLDEDDNWVSCSMLTNSIKANWTLDQLRWKLLPPGNLEDWDGMIGWFLAG